MSRLIHKLKLIDEAGAIEERVIWEVPRNARQSQGIRYRLAYVPRGQLMLKDFSKTSAETLRR